MIIQTQQTPPVLEEVECIHHPRGYCIIASGLPFDPRYFPWKTLCGQYIMIPLGGKRCRPTCVVCKEVLDAQIS